MGLKSFFGKCKVFHSARQKQTFSSQVCRIRFCQEDRNSGKSPAAPEFFGSQVYTCRE